MNVSDEFSKLMLIKIIWLVYKNIIKTYQINYKYIQKLYLHNGNGPALKNSKI